MTLKIICKIELESEKNKNLNHLNNLLANFKETSALLWPKKVRTLKFIYMDDIVLAIKIVVAIIPRVMIWF